MFRIVLLTTTAVFCQYSSADDVVLWRTALHDRQTGGVTGRWLTLPDSAPPVRAWAGIQPLPAGDPARQMLQQQHQREWHQQLQHWRHDPQAADDLPFRKQHTHVLAVHFTDVVLTQQHDGRFFIFHDDDCDGVLESVTETLVEQTHDLHQSRQILLSATSSPQLVGIAPPQIINRTVDTAEPAANDGDPVHRLKSRLEWMDHPARRKQHLREIISASATLLQKLRDQPATSRQELADVLYRRGRALGYRELPDVRVRWPIEDPDALHTAFEATFSELGELVDVTQPRYILLAIRRERRLENRGRALALLETYRKHHPDPAWYLKKRADLLKELLLPTAAHQAAATLWHSGTRPAKLQPVIIRIECADDIGPVAGTWAPSPPWCETEVRLTRIDVDTSEGVVWLKPQSLHQLEVRGTRLSFCADEGLLQIRISEETGRVSRVSAARAKTRTTATSP